MVVAFQVRIYLHICVFMIAGHRLSMETILIIYLLELLVFEYFNALCRLELYLKRASSQHPELALVNWVEVLTQPPRLNV